MLLRDRKTLWGLFNNPFYKEARAAQPIFASTAGYFGTTFGVSDTKVDVNHNVSMNTGFVYKCVELRSNAQATALLNKQKLYYYATPKEKIEVDEDHPYFQVMRYVNDQLTPYDLWKITASSFDFIGRMPWWVETELFDGATIPVRINPIFPDMGRFTVNKDVFGKITGYTLFAGLKTIKFEPEEIFYHTDVNVNDSTYGLGLVNSMIREANIDRLQKQKVLKLLENGGLGKAHVQFAKGLRGDPFKVAVSEFDEHNNGLNREGSFLYTTEDTKITPLVDPATLEHAVGVLGLTKDQIINLSGCMRASFEATNKADAFIQRVIFMQDVITPLIVNLTSRLSQDFLQRYYPQDRGWLAVECESIIPNDVDAEDLHIQNMLRTGRVTINELLIADGKDPIGEEGDKRYVTGDLIPVGENILNFQDLFNQQEQDKNDKS